MKSDVARCGLTELSIKMLESRAGAGAAGATIALSSVRMCQAIHSRWLVLARVTHLALHSQPCACQYRLHCFNLSTLVYKLNIQVERVLLLSMLTLNIALLNYAMPCKTSAVHLLALPAGAAEAAWHSPPCTVAGVTLVHVEV